MVLLLTYAAMGYLILGKTAMMATETMGTDAPRSVQWIMAGIAQMPRIGAHLHALSLPTREA